jgi:hypothetical protein
MGTKKSSHMFFFLCSIYTKRCQAFSLHESAHRIHLSVKLDTRCGGSVWQLLGVKPLHLFNSVFKVRQVLVSA